MNDIARAAPGALTLNHVDVFTHEPLSGNGLTVVIGADGLTADTMLRIAQELRQFETIFLSGLTDDGADARIFTPEEELMFAGHPVLGAAAVLHARQHPDARLGSWTIRIDGRPIHVATVAREHGVIAAEMDQGPAALSPPQPPDVALRFASAVGLSAACLRTDLPAQVVSTGLPYLLLPVTPEGLAASHVVAGDLPTMLATLGAEFLYVLDPDRPEGRTWDQRGVTEDVATGSAAGPTAAYLIHHGRRSAAEPFEVHQGQFVGRPSHMDVRQADDGSIQVGGLVAPFSSGTIERAVFDL
jgi:trans-2,3-dihydro-3-hydroxyanthranilate isomerase